MSRVGPSRVGSSRFETLADQVSFGKNDGALQQANRLWDLYFLLPIMRFFEYQDTNTCQGNVSRFLEDL